MAKGWLRATHLVLEAAEEERRSSAQRCVALALGQRGGTSLKVFAVAAAAVAAS